MRERELNARTDDMANPFEENPFKHQGALLSFDTSSNGSEYTAEICFELFPSPDATRKKRFTWSFSGVTDLVLTLNSAQLGKNIFRSNIVDCKIYETEQRLFLYLSDGYIKLDFKEMRAEPRSTEQRAANFGDQQIIGSHFANRYWHDGVLSSYKTALQDNDYSLDICVELYDTEEESRRQTFRWTFPRVKTFILIMDMTSMTQNMTAGNISDCEVNMEEKRLSIYLAEGFLQLDFDDVAEAKRSEA